MRITQVLAAQTRLAKDLRRRPELYQIYLVELLTLFADKGVAIQNAAISNHHAKVSIFGVCDLCLGPNRDDSSRKCQNSSPLSCFLLMPF